MILLSTSSVTPIGDYAFGDCENLTSITFNGTKDQWNSIIRADGYLCNGGYTIHCADGDIMFGFE